MLTLESFFFFFNDTATTEIYTLSLHDALPIFAEQNKGIHVTKLYVGNLSYGMTDESLLQLFSEKGYKAVSARIITDRETGRSRGFGFVELGPGDDATRAIGEFRSEERRVGKE